MRRRHGLAKAKVDEVARRLGLRRSLKLKGINRSVNINIRLSVDVDGVFCILDVVLLEDVRYKIITSRSIKSLATSFIPTPISTSTYTSP